MDRSVGFQQSLGAERNSVEQSTSNRSRVITYSFTLLFAMQGMFNGLTFPVSAMIVLIALPCLFIVLMIVSGIKPHRENEIDRTMVTLVAALFLWYTIQFLRSILALDFGIATQTATNLFASTLLQSPLFAGVVFVTATIPPRWRGEVLRNSLFRSLVAVCLIEFALFFLGVDHADKEFIPQTQRPALFFSLFGINVNRFLPPISTGMTNAMVIPLFLVIFAWFRKRFSISFVIGMIFLLMNDSRTYMAAIPIALVVYQCLRGHRTILVIVSALLPLTLFSLVVFKNIAPEILNFTNARYDVYGLFSGREYLWNVFLDYLNNASVTQIFFGNGVYGQALAGISTSYDFIFAGWNDAARELASLHNGYLQIVVDAGLVGLTLYVLLVVLLVRRFLALSQLDKENSSFWKSLLVFTIALLVVSNSEVTITFYGREGFTVLFALAVIALSSAPAKIVSLEMMQRRAVTDFAEAPLI